VKNHQKRILIAGVGNKIRRDDGIGLVIIEMLEEQKKITSDKAALLNAGTDSFMLLGAIEQYEKAIIIDAVDMQASPGTVKAFTPTQAKIAIKYDTLSTHGFGLAETICLAEKLGFKTQIEIIGIQPQDISFGEGLTEVVNQSCPQILSLIEENLYDE
jgi:hydrogenase maturation protease